MSISKEKFKEMLREKGLKVTNQRILVLEVLADHRDKHLTAEDIYELVREDYPEIGLATIYRTVQGVPKKRQKNSTVSTWRCNFEERKQWKNAYHSTRRSGKDRNEHHSF